MTFTEAAAAEMRKRLGLALSDALAMTEDDFLTEQLAQLADAHITTLHAFCLRLIKDEGYRLGFDPAMTNNILSDASRAVLEQEALDDVLNHVIEEDPDTYAKIANQVLYKMHQRQPLEQLIRTLAEVVPSQMIQTPYLQGISTSWTPIVGNP